MTTKIRRMPAKRRYLGQAEAEPKVKKISKGWFWVFGIVVILALAWWKKDWIMKLFARKTITLPPEVITKIVTKEVHTSTFPIKKGSSGDIVLKMQKAYNTMPKTLIPKRTTLLKEDGVWGNAMETAFKQNNFKTSFSEADYNDFLKNVLTD